MHRSFLIDDKHFTWFYYLTDGIYSQWKTFVNSLQIPTTNKEKYYADYRKEHKRRLGRLFGVLFRQYRHFLLPCELRSVEKRRTVDNCCDILHNLTVEVRRQYYTSDGVGGTTARYGEVEDKRIL